MSQPWKKRYPLIAFHGNNGNINGAPPAAHRYTESKLSIFGESMLKYIDMDTINMVPNYDETEKEPEYLSGLFCNSLLNGCEGIATGLATHLAPHYAKDIYAAFDYIMDCLIDSKPVDDSEIFKIVRAPDFPTGGRIINPGELEKIYAAGRGPVQIRANYEIETKGKKTSIVFVDIPYGVLKKKLVENIGFLLYSKNDLDGVTEVRDESGKEGIRIVVELKANANIQRILNTLFKKTPLQTSFSINNVLISPEGRPIENVSLTKMMEIFIKHVCKVIFNRTKFSMKKDMAKLEIINGYLICNESIDEVIATIRESDSTDDAIVKLQSTFELTEAQAKAIVSRQLGSLNKMSTPGLLKDKEVLDNNISKYKEIISNKISLFKQTKVELAEFAASPMFKKDERRTVIDYTATAAIDDRDTIVDESLVLIYTHNGMIKAVKSEEYNTQKRHGMGVSVKTREDDYIEKILTVSSKDDLVIVTDKGNGYVVPVYQIPVVSKSSLGKYINNYVSFENGETIVSILATENNDKEHNLLFVTKNGLAKKMTPDNLPKRSGCRVISFKDGDSLVGCYLVKDDDEILTVTNTGLGLKTYVKNVSCIASRNSSGNTLMKFKNENSYVVSTVVGTEDSTVLIITENGLSKRVCFKDIPTRKNRGGKGLIVYKPTEKTGLVKAAVPINEDETIFITTVSGMIIRIKANSISEGSRASHGIYAIKLKKDDSVASISSAPEEEETKEESSNE